MLDTVNHATPFSASVPRSLYIVGEVRAARAVFVRPPVHELVDDELFAGRSNMSSRCFGPSGVSNTYLLLSNSTIGSWRRARRPRRARA